jgi:sugar phosphate isomerase/epimerase
VADPRPAHDLVASFFTLSGAGFAEPPRHRFVERCEAAAAAGFIGVGLHADDLNRTVASGVSVNEMRDVLQLNGLSVVEIEFLGGWTDLPPGSFAPSLDAILAVADAFGGRHVSGGEFRADIALDADTAAASLRAHADRVAQSGLLVAVEAFPWSAMNRVETAIDLVRRSNAPNAGILVDVWHFYHCGGSVEQLVDLPGAGIAAVQLNDGPRVHDDFLTAARTHRALPGEGDLDVVGLIRAVGSAGFVGPWCVEVNTPQFRALPVAEAARQAAARSREVLGAALGN